jgi:hypothetical protein
MGRESVSNHTPTSARMQQEPKNINCAIETGSKRRLLRGVELSCESTTYPRNGQVGDTGIEPAAATKNAEV